MSFHEDYLGELLEAGAAWSIGSDHWLSWFGWAPDRELNPQYEGVADVERAGVQVWHRRASGVLCCGAVTFRSPAMELVMPGRPMWDVESWEPLTFAPSVLCRFPLEAGGECGDHGYVREGRWVTA